MAKRLQIIGDFSIGNISDEDIQRIAEEAVGKISEDSTVVKEAVDNYLSENPPTQDSSGDVVEF